MNNNLTNFSCQRNWKEAIIFYIAYSMLGLFTAVVLGGIIGSFSIDGYYTGYIVGILFAPIYTVILYFGVYIKKRINSIVFIFVGIFAAYIAFQFGIFFSVIIIAILTTRGNGKSTKDKLDLNEKDINSVTNKEDPLS